MRQETFYIFGQIITDRDKQDVLELRVEAWDKDFIFNDLIGSALTDSDGSFEITFDSSHFQELFLDRQPDLFFKVYRGDELIRSTEDSVLWNTEVGNTPVSIEVDMPIGDTEERLTVRGRIFGQDGKPVAGVTVKSFDVDFRVEKPLGATVTDADGRYETTYMTEQLARSDKSKTHLVIRAYTADLVLLGVSETHFNAGPDEQIDLVVTAPNETGASEFERLSASLSRISSGTALSGLTESDIEFLAADTGIEEARIALLSRAVRIASTTGLPEEALYAWGRTGTELELDSLLSRDWGVLQTALAGAVEEQLVSPRPLQMIDGLKGRMERLRLDEGLLVRHEFVGRLIDEEKQKPLKGYKVHAHDLDAEGGPRDLGFDTTSLRGLFSFSYIAPPTLRTADEDVAGGGRRLRLQILDQKDQEILETELDASPDQTEALAISVPVPREPDPADVSLRAFSAAHGIDLPGEVLEALEQRGLSTLRAVREAGGLASLKDLRLTADLEQIRTLDAHVNLSVLSDDFVLNQKLVENGLNSIASIARLPLEAFLGQVKEFIDEAIGAKLHAAARAQTLYLDNLYAGLRADLANGRDNPLLKAVQKIDLDLFPEHCKCDDCESAVSPLAYLADLLDYTLDHVQQDGSPVDLNWLENTLHQPFGDLPATCDAVEEKVHQVRICVEALRSGLDHGTEGLRRAEEEYALTAYQHLLSQFGTSYEELRLASTADSTIQRALAERLGVDYRPWSQSALRDILLKPEELNEWALEILFGLADTKRHPLSTAAKIDDEHRQIARWSLRGVTWGRNTDADGRVNVKLSQPNDSVYRVELFRDQLFRELVAAGERSTLAGLIALAEKNSSGLTGTVEIRYVADDKVVICAVPVFLSERLKHLRTLWESQDWPDDPYWADAPPWGRLPVIDPDLIGPDDFRHPFAGDTAFDLWMARRAQVDAALDELEQSKAARDFPALMQETLGVSMSELRSLAEEVRRGDDPDKIQERVVEELRLTEESLIRLMELYGDYEAAQASSQAETLTDDKWREVYSILVQAKKSEWVKAAGGWINQEQERGISLGPKTFWSAIQEPEIGHWPPLAADKPLPVTYPLIDPDVVAMKDLPEPTIGKGATRLWQDRAEALAALRTSFKEIQGLDAKLAFAFGYPLPHDLDRLQELLNGDNPRLAVSAAQTIKSDLCMTVEDFAYLMDLRSELGPHGTSPQAMRKEWTELEAILVSAKKVKALYGPWVAEEEGLSYWQVLKARLPKWRASIEARQTWVRGLTSRSRSPAIDPDLIDWRHFTNPGIDTPSKLRGQRIKWLEYRLSRLNGYSRNLEGLADRVRNNVGPMVEIEDLSELKKRADDGDAIGSRLEQLNLTFDALARLVAVYWLLRRDRSVLESDWEDVNAILLRVAKEREYGAWIEQERENGILLGPDHFKLPDPPALQFPTKPPEPLPPWRATWSEQRDWQDRLETRIDQNLGTIQAFREAVEAVEETCLHELRDALIEAYGLDGYSLEEWAPRLADYLLIDTRMAGSVKTTRIAQAIETLQSLLWSLHTERLNAVHPVLSLSAKDFDQEWEWLGFYASWRSAMFVFLYPENLLLPSLRRRQTPAFEQLVTQLRDNRMLSPEQACSIAEFFADYLRDVGSLRVEVTCQAKGFFRTGSCRSQGAAQDKDVLFFFALPQKNNGRLYWSTCSVYDGSKYSQSFWKQVAGTSDATRIIGAVPYDRSTTQRFIVLFYTACRNRKTILAFRIFNLHTGDWSAEIELATPTASITSIVAAQQENPILAPLIVITTRNSVYCRPLTHDLSGWVSNGAGVNDQRHDENDWEDYCIRRTDLNHISYTGRGAFLTAFCYEEGFAIVERGGDTCYWSYWDNPNDSKYIYYNSHISFWSHNPAVSREKPQLLAEDRICISEWYGGFQSGGTISLLFKKDNEPLAYFYYRGQHETPCVCSISRNLESIVPSYGPCISKYETQTYSQSIRPLILNTGLGQPKLVLGIVQAKRTLANCFCALYLTNPSEVVPPIDPDIEIREQLSPREHYIRTDWIDLYLDMTGGGPNKIYLEEAYFFAPLQIGIRLHQIGYFEAALNWFRTVYDFSAPLEERKIYPGLIIEGSYSDEFDRGTDWLVDPLNPHAIAETRPLACTRFTLTSIIRCLLDYADSEFSKDSAEALERARGLYLEALGLLEAPELKQQSDTCEQTIAKLALRIGDEGTGLGTGSMRSRLSSVDDGTAMEYLSSDIHREMSLDSVPFDQRFNRSLDLISEHLASVQSTLSYKNMVEGEDASVERIQAVLLSQAAVLEVMKSPIGPLSTEQSRVYGGYSDVPNYLPDNLPQTYSRNFDFVTTTGETATKVIPGGVYGLAATARLFEFCVPPNPVTDSLRLHAQLNLYKLRTGRNIAGIEREHEPYSAPIDTVSGMPQIGAGGQVVSPSAVNLAPTPYRYQVLIERAKELTQIAGQIEMAMLSAIEKRDAEHYRLLEARQQVELSRAGVRLQDLRVREAEDGVDFAELGRERATIQREHYGKWIQAGLNQYELAMKDHYQDIAEVETTAAAIHYGFLGFQRAESTGSLFSKAGSMLGGSVGGLIGGVIGVGGAAIGTVKEYEAKAKAIQATANAHIAAVNAAFQRRLDEWQLLKALAGQDYRIAGQQIVLARDRVQVVGQERKIAELQADHASDVVNYLSTKFTNVELYDWMAGVLAGVYGFFLQQATAMARTAERQLAFERQETPVGYLQSDYWSMPEEGALPAEEEGPDRLGLTGSARLLQDIYRLDLYRFETERRKLDLSKTLSLAELDPFAFQRFRETGVLPFATPIKLFDRDFPGHYLRLIKRVRTSVIALVPPVRGIRVTLSTTGISRAVVGPDIFQTILIRRDPESVALTSPIDATGVFELQPETEMLLPFEGLGVDSTWELRLPKPANPLDYLTIADVLITFEYTALDSFAYRAQVIQGLDRRFDAHRPFSFRYQFPDQWWDLHNPEQTANPMEVSFSIAREDFPPNIDGLKIRDLIVYFVRRDGASFEIQVENLQLGKQADQKVIGGPAATVDGIISTRRGNAGGWMATQGESPVGIWTLVLQDTSEVRRRFSEGEIEDILFVIGVTGIGPEWPS